MMVPSSQEDEHDDYDDGSYDSHDGQRMTRGRRGADYVNDSYGMDSQGFGNDASRRGRKENGLVELTKKFIHLLKTADE